MLDYTLGEQYCDGIRGGLVVYDPEDPNRCEYDSKFKPFCIDIRTIWLGFAVDDGMCQAQKSIAPNVCVESTIISLSEWCEPLFRGRPVSDTLQF